MVLSNNISLESTPAWQHLQILGNVHCDRIIGRAVIQIPLLSQLLSTMPVLRVL